MSDIRTQAIDLFEPLGPRYDRLGALLSLGQDPRWRRAMVARVPDDRGHVLDVATGTGLVAEELLARGHRVTGLDQSSDMLAVARRRFGSEVGEQRVGAAEGDASEDGKQQRDLEEHVIGAERERDECGWDEPEDEPQQCLTPRPLVGRGRGWG